MSTEPELPSSTTLNEIKSAHAAVRACIDEMAALTARREVSQLEYTQARLRISQASMARRICFNSVCNRLRQNAPPKVIATIDQLMREDRELRAKSAAHISRWTAATIEADWKGYCAASLEIQRDMEEELSAEEALLFPLL